MNLEFGCLVPSSDVPLDEYSVVVACENNFILELGSRIAERVVDESFHARAVLEVPHLDGFVHAGCHKFGWTYDQYFENPVLVLLRKLPLQLAIGRYVPNHDLHVLAAGYQLLLAALRVSDELDVSDTADVAAHFHQALGLVQIPDLDPLLAAPAQRHRVRVNLLEGRNGFLETLSRDALQLVRVPDFHGAI